MTKSFLTTLAGLSHDVWVETRSEELRHILVDVLQYLGCIVIGPLEECEWSMGNHLAITVHLYVHLFGNGMA